MEVLAIRFFEVMGLGIQGFRLSVGSRLPQVSTTHAVRGLFSSQDVPVSQSDQATALEEVVSRIFRNVRQFLPREGGLANACRPGVA